MNLRLQLLYVELALTNTEQTISSIAEVKKFFRGRDPRPIVFEIKEGELTREANLIRSLTPFQAETVSEL